MSQTAAIKTIRLTPRDIEIILAVFNYDSLFSYQIRRRFWGQNSHPRTFLERLAQLIKADYLRARPMDSTTGRGSGQRLITIGQASHALLRDRLGLSETEIKRLRHSIMPSDWRHDAAVRDFRLSLELAAAVHPHIAEIDWVNECVFKRAAIKTKVPDQASPQQLLTVELVPDGAFTVLLSSGQIKHHYLELDRDTEHRSKIIGRLRAYLQHVGSDQKPVLWVVPSQVRALKLARWIQQEADNLQARAAIFAITTQEQIDEQQILTAPIWQVVGVSEKRSLLPSSAQPTEAVDGEVWLRQLGQEPAVA
jgi:hypothetical protein